MALGYTLVAVALAIAVIDWWAVAEDRLSVEYVAKPLTLVAVIGAALAFDPFSGAVRTLIVVALVLSLVGDIVLMVPTWPFEGGLGAFLLAHLATIAALLSAGVSTGWLGIGAAALVGPLVLVGRPIVNRARTSDSRLGVAVGAYIAVLGTMGLLAIATGSFWAIIAGVLFVASDALLGWGRFVSAADEDAWGGRVAVHVTYHLAQLAFVGWLVTGVTR